MRASSAALALLVAGLACASIAPSAALPFDEEAVELDAGPVAAPPELPKFGFCSPELSTVNVTEYTRKGMKLAELRAYEASDSGCIEALVQALVLPATGKRVLIRSGQPGGRGLAHAGTVRLDPSRSIKAVAVFSGNGRSSAAGCITKIELETEGPAGYKKLFVQSRAFEMNLARPPVTWQATHYVAALHMKSLRHRCDTSSGYPLMQVLPSRAVPAQPGTQRLVAASEGDGFSDYDSDGVEQAAAGGDGFSGVKFWYPTAAVFPEEPAFASDDGIKCGARGPAAITPEAPLSAGAQLVALQAFSSPKTGCIEALAQKYKLEGHEGSPIILRAGSAGSLVEAGLQPGEIVEVSPSDEFERITIGSSTRHGCITHISLRKSDGTAQTLGARRGGRGRSQDVDLSPPRQGLGGFVAEEAREYCRETTGYPLTGVRPVFVSSPATTINLSAALAANWPGRFSKCAQYPHATIKGGVGPVSADGEPPLTASTWNACCKLCSSRTTCHFFTWGARTKACTLWRPVVGTAGEASFSIVQELGAFSGEMLTRRGGSRAESV